jgi:predicted permease
VAGLFTTLTGLGFGLFPALRAGHTGFAALREGARAGGGRKQRLRAVLVTVEVTVSVVLLITSGLLIRAVWRVQGINPGFRSDRVLTLNTALPRPKYESAIRRTEFYDRVLTGVRALPGVESAAFISGLPMIMTGIITEVMVPGHDSLHRRAGGGVSHRWVTPQYFRAMGIPIHRGRDVQDADTRDRPWVAVVSESFVQRYWPDQDPIGKTFSHRGQTRTVVGVVGDVKVRGLERTSEPQIYLPAQQVPDGWPVNFEPKDLVIRQTADVATLLPAIRRVVRAADPEQPIAHVRTMDEVLAGETAARRVQMQVLSVLAGLAVLLSSIGIYGLLAYTVSQRSQEIAVRLALGAEPARVGRMIFADGMRLAAIGLVPGVLVAYGAARAMSALLFGVPPGDPATFAAAVGLVLVMTVIGSVVPALRALRVTPGSALRADL